MEETTKTFDCVQMKQLGAITVLNQIRDMSLEEETLFWQENTTALLARQSGRKSSDKARQVKDRDLAA